jgi:AcrR family transcriptional regulator
MGRPKKFNRDDLLDKVALVFWENGLKGTTLQDLEKATGVNKSGLCTNAEHLFKLL